MLFHSSCPKWEDKTKGPVPRLLLIEQGVSCSRTYRCERCQDQIHIDMDWSEGATPEPKAVLS